MTTASAIQHAPCLNSFLTGKQSPTLSPPPATTNHLVSPLLKKYAELGLPAAVVTAWTLDTINAAIATGPHVSTLTPETTVFYQQELLEWAQRGFRIILLVDMSLLVFGSRIRISRLASMDQANRKPRLICNYSAAPDVVTPAVNAFTKKSTAPNVMQFWSCLPQFLKKIWNADPSDGLVWLSKWEISDDFHQCLLRPEDIGAFTYVVPPLPTNTSTVLRIDLILPMGCVNSPDMLCEASEIGMYVANGYVLDPTSYFEI